MSSPHYPSASQLRELSQSNYDKVVAFVRQKVKAALIHEAGRKYFNVCVDFRDEWDTARALAAERIELEALGYKVEITTVDPGRNDPIEQHIRIWW